MTSFLRCFGISALLIAALTACTTAAEVTQAPGSQPAVGDELTEKELNRILEDIIAF
jgi:hypothetical protein